MSQNDWQTFFDAHAPQYMENVFTQNTAAEVAFIINEFALPPGSRILDIGCGTGRHAVELARQGYRVTGVDLSAGMLARARDAAAAAGVSVELIQADASRFTPEAEAFDGAICVCEGAFGLLGQADDPLEHDQGILRAIATGLKPGAPALLTLLSALRIIRMMTPDDIAQGVFDPITLTVRGSMDLAGPEGTVRIPTRERFYTAPEITRLCRDAGLTIDYLGGGTAGRWGRRPLELDEFEIMLIARKPAR